MKVSLVKLSILVFVFCLVLEATVNATPIGNHWHVSDPRCFGRPASNYRLERSATTNNKPKKGQYWTYNANAGSCERLMQGKPLIERSAFDSQSECDRACRNIYHF